MPKKNALITDREKAICARVKQLREELEFSQPAFASELKITLDQLASIEYGRVPLRYALGSWLCWRFDINQRWLADGVAPQNWCQFISPRVLQLIHPQMLFSEAYDKFLRLAAEENLKHVAERLGCGVPEIRAEDAHWVWAGALNNASQDVFEFILCRSIKAYLVGMPSFHFGQFYRDIRDARDRLAKQLPASAGVASIKTKIPKKDAPLFAITEYEPGSELFPITAKPDNKRRKK